MKSYAFSLIELMVVIAIIGVLTTISIPIYQKYITVSKLGTYWPQLNAIAETMIDYANTNGQFPSASDLGYQTSGNNYTVANPQTIIPNLNYLLIDDIDGYNGLTPCGRIGLVQFNIPSSAVNSKESGSFSLYIYIWHTNNTYVKTPAYITPNQDSGSFLPGAVNVFQDVSGDWTYWSNFYTAHETAASCAG